MLPRQAYTVQYGPPGRYYVRRESDKASMFAHDSKSTCIAYAEDMNGWPVTGSESGYVKSRANSEGWPR